MGGLGRGYVHVYTGDGKGKTTAALGLCLRATGRGLRCFVIQFLRGNVEWGEVSALKRLGVEVRQMGREEAARPDEPHEQIDHEWCNGALRVAGKVLEKGEHDLVVLDEVHVAIARGLVKADDVLRLLDRRAEHVEVALTGAGAPPEIMAAAHVVTEMRCVKHYSDVGVAPRAGIEH